MLELILFCLAVIAAITLILRRPFSRMLGISMNWEIAAGSLVIIGFCFFVVTRFLVPQMIEKDLVKQPCGNESPQGVCYNLTRSVCEVAWQSAESSCKAEFSQISKDRPTALIGPGFNRCKARRMDQTLHFNRIKESTAYCRAYFDYIDQK